MAPVRQSGLPGGLAPARRAFVLPALVVTFFVVAPTAFVPGGRPESHPRPTRPRVAMSGAAPTAGVMDTVFKLPEIIADAVDDMADMFGATISPEFAPQAVSSLGMADDGVSNTGLLQTMSIRAAAGSERRLGRQLSRFVESAQADSAVTTVAAVRNPDDPCDFTVLLRYASMGKMLDHQKGERFKDLMESLEPHLERPVGLYLMDEQLGQLGTGRHPFGPGGEGGRDDAIYSSRKGRR